MSPPKKNTFGNRLKLARKMAGFSLQDLATKLENVITKQALSKYENGQMNPSSSVVSQIAAAFSLKPEYFLKETKVSLGKIQFRKRARLSKKQEEAIVEKVRDYVERYLEIEDILQTTISFKNPIFSSEVCTKPDVKHAADVLRIHWGLANTPILNLVSQLEQQGVKVLLIDADDDFDGLAVYSSNGVPIVAINSRNKPVERIRFTIIHELAHLLLNLCESVLANEKEVEKYCHYFASCFLLPEAILIKQLGANRTYIRIDELKAIKEQYGISIRAVLHRLKEIQVISDTYYKRWVVYLTKRFGAKNEPGAFPGKEKSLGFNQLVNKALAEELISMSKAASLWNIDVDEIRKGFGGAE